MDKELQELTKQRQEKVSQLEELLEALERSTASLEQQVRARVPHRTMCSDDEMSAESEDGCWTDDQGGRWQEADRDAKAKKTTTQADQARRNNYIYEPKLYTNNNINLVEHRSMIERNIGYSKSLVYDSNLYLLPNHNNFINNKILKISLDETFHNCAIEEISLNNISNVDSTTSSNFGGFSDYIETSYTENRFDYLPEPEPETEPEPAEPEPIELEPEYEPEPIEIEPEHELEPELALV